MAKYMVETAGLVLPNTVVPETMVSVPDDVRLLEFMHPDAGPATA
jgi:hypothetical protein